jgi:hypothetical protein
LLKKTKRYYVCILFFNANIFDVAKKYQNKEGSFLLQREAFGFLNASAQRPGAIIESESNIGFLFKHKATL